MTDEQVEIKGYIKSILELVEDKEFPARRNITDYVFLILSVFDGKFAQEIDKYMNEFYNKVDKEKEMPCQE